MPTRKPRPRTVPSTGHLGPRGLVGESCRPTETQAACGARPVGQSVGRSQMALGWFGDLAAARAIAWSAGSEPVSGINPGVETEPVPTSPELQDASARDSRVSPCRIRLEIRPRCFAAR